MRLICPSCGAQYEVDDAVIPETGRDVQCSSCGQAWFQHSAAQIKAQQAVAQDTQSGPGTAWDAMPDDGLPPEDTPADTPQNAPDDGRAGQVATDADDTDEAGETAAPPPPEAQELRRRTLDDAVRNVLREEAAREARARRSEGLESQPDLGLASAVAAAPATTGTGPASEAGRDRMARLRGETWDDAAEDDTLAGRGMRRELLPDIEEINSTLRATSERGDEAASRDAPETLRRRRSGFRLGFFTSLIAAILLLGAYVFAPTISALVPALKPVLGRYVAQIDTARLWLDTAMKSSTEAMRGGSAPDN